MNYEQKLSIAKKLSAGVDKKEIVTALELEGLSKRAASRGINDLVNPSDLFYFVNLIFVALVGVGLTVLITGDTEWLPLTVMLIAIPYTGISILASSYLYNGYGNRLLKAKDYDGFIDRVDHRLALLLVFKEVLFFIAAYLLLKSALA